MAIDILFTNSTWYVTDLIHKNLRKHPSFLKLGHKFFLFLFGYLTHPSNASSLSWFRFPSSTRMHLRSSSVLFSSDWLVLLKPNCLLACFSLNRPNFRNTLLLFFFVSAVCFLQIQQLPLQTVRRTGIILLARAKQELYWLPSNVSRVLNLYRTLYTIVRQWQTFFIRLFFND